MVVATVVLSRGSTSSRLLWYRLLGKPAVDFSVVPVVGLQWITRSRKLWLHPTALRWPKSQPACQNGFELPSRGSRIMKIGAKQIMHVPAPNGSVKCLLYHSCIIREWNGCREQMAQNHSHEGQDKCLIGCFLQSMRILVIPKSAL